MFEFKPHHRNVPDRDLLDDLRRVARQLNLPTMSQAIYRQHGLFNPLTLCSRFQGWNSALKKAGLIPSRHFRVPAKAVLADVRRVARKLKTKHLLLTQYVIEGNYSMTLIYRHYQTWSRILAAAGLAPSTYQPRTTDHVLFENLEKLWRLRYQILKQDHFKCRSCGRSPATDPDVRLQVDHLKPWSLGGETIPENLQTLCDRCNIGKSNL